MAIKYGTIQPSICCSCKRYKSAESFDGMVMATIYGHHKTVNMVDSGEAYLERIIDNIFAG
jgi:hypothetical protein